jgi:hypothetical protein
VLAARYGSFGSSSSTGSIRGSGVAATQARHVARFDAVELAGSNAVDVRIGAPRSVVVHADDNLIGRVTTAVRGGTLVVADRPGSFSPVSPTSVEVTVPSLTALRLTGSGIVTVVGIDSPRLVVALPGSGLLRASGSAGRLVVDLGGSGDAELGGLVARDARAAVGGSGRIVVTATRSLDARVTGSGAILYSGSPTRVSKSVTGSGAIVGG